jgi:MFS family permease
MLLTFLGGIGGGIVFPILPILGVQLGLSGYLIGLILAANRITRLVVNPLTGLLVDRIGGKLPLTLGLLVEAVATGTYSLALHTSHPGAFFLAGRSLWGVGSSLLMVGGLTVGLNASRPENRGRIMAMVRTAMSLGMPAGLVMGGLIAGLVSDNAAFLAATGLALAGAVVAWTLMPNIRAERVEEAAPPPASSASACKRARARVRAVAERSLRMARDLRISTIWLSNLLIYFSVQGVLLTTLVLFVDHRHLTIGGLGAQPTAGFVMGVLLLASGVVALLIGRQLDRITFRMGAALPAVLASVAGFVVLGLAHGLMPVLAAMVLLGVGMGGSTVPLITLLGDLTPPAERGYAVGLYQFCGDVGGSLGPIVGVDAVLGIGFVPVYFAVAGLLVLTLPLLYWLWQAERRAEERG